MKEYYIKVRFSSYPVGLSSLQGPSLHTYWVILHQKTVYTYFSIYVFSLNILINYFSLLLVCLVIFLFVL